MKRDEGQGGAVFRSIATLGRVLGVVALSALTLLVAAEVVGRSIFAITLPFGEELGGYLLIAVTFLAAADSFASGGFMRVDLLFERLPERARRRLDRALALVGALLSGTLCWYLGRLVASSYRNGVVSPTLASIPLWVPQSVATVGTLLLAVACLRRALTGGADGEAAPPPAERLGD